MLCHVFHHLTNQMVFLTQVSVPNNPNKTYPRLCVRGDEAWFRDGEGEEGPQPGKVPNLRNWHYGNTDLNSHIYYNGQTYGRAK